MSTITKAMGAATLAVGVFVGPPARGEEKVAVIVLRVPGTKAYDGFVAKLPLSPFEARKRMEAFSRLSGPCLGRHHVMINDWYVFSFRDKTELRLGGCYVDGRTGDVMKVSAEDAREMFGHRFPRGTIPLGEIKKIVDEDE